MTALLVICTFAFFIGLDWLVRSRQKADEPAPRLAAATAAAPEPTWVAGYRLPESLHYHQGHTWARVLDPVTVMVGVDDFAGRLIGSAKKLRLPAVGSWLKQGRRGFGLRADSRQAEFLSPVEGEVVEVNSDLRRQPDLATADPYGRGWILKIRVDDLGADLRNLLSGRLARRWLQEAREGLELRLMALSGSVLQDGGEPAAGFARHLSDDDWNRLAKDFFLA